MRLSNIVNLSGLTASNIRHSAATLAAVLTVAACAPNIVWARTHHHHRHHSRHYHVSTATPALVSPSPVSVAGSYAHTAAIRLASAVNRTRNVVNGGPATAQDIRMSRHELRVAERRQEQHERQVHVAAQVLALHSGDPVAAAYAMRGTRYVMGGTSRSGFDCSGFVRYILSCTDGVALPRTASEQYYHGTPITRAELQPGDLVFFQNTYKHGISHVGIYTGNGMFVHACNPSKGVREDNLDTPYYAKHFAGARRVKNFTAVRP